MDSKFARGRSSELFRLDDGKVLKLFFDNYPLKDVEREFKNTKIAYLCGCTKSKVYDLVNKNNRSGFTMDYIDGISQNDMPSKNIFYIFKGGKDLAKCHVLVHNKYSHDLTDIRLIALDALKEEPFSNFTNEEKQKISSYILSLPESDTIIHMDFHTGNVLVDKSGNCTVIDWMTAARGNRAIEYAMMEFLFKDAELFPEKSKFINACFGKIRGMIGRQYFKTYQKLMPLEKKEVNKFRIIALIIRRSWNIEFEKNVLTKQIREIINVEYEN